MELEESLTNYLINLYLQTEIKGFIQDVKRYPYTNLYNIIEDTSYDRNMNQILLEILKNYDDIISKRLMI